MNEFELIKKYLAPLTGNGSFKLTDDAALIDVAKHQKLIISQDTILAGIHFLKNSPPDKVAQKAVRVNLSDIIAKGGKAMCYSLSLGLPKGWGEKEMKLLTNGLKSEQKKFKIKLTGGDTYSSPKGLCISITMLGIPHKNYIGRKGAKAGDILCVTGKIGDAALGLKVAKGKLKTSNDNYFLRHYHCPQFKDISKAISKYATSAMDISDGLIGDCKKLCQASKVSTTIEASNVPLSPPAKKALKKNKSLLKTILTGGDDYQILCTVPKKNWQKFKASIHSAQKIGMIEKQRREPLAITNKGVLISFAVESYIHEI